MFDKRKDVSEEKIPPASPTPDFNRQVTDNFSTRSSAVIGQTIKIKGDISGDENLIVEGTIDGSISLPNSDLTIGQSGQVKANLSAKTVKVDGQVTGDIDGGEKVIVSKSGRVQGNIVSPRVTLEDGAKFKGSIDMDPGEPLKPAKPTPAKVEPASTSDGAKQAS